MTDYIIKKFLISFVIAPSMLKESYLTEKFISVLSEKYFHVQRLESLNPKHLAILGIDLQRYFLEPGRKAYLPSSPELINRLRNFYAYAKERGISIILTRHWHDGNIMERWWKSPMPRNSSETRILEEFRKYGDVIIEKNTYDAFHRTNLEDLLKEKGIETVIITGVMTHLCCETTARSAFVRGFNVIFPIEGTLTQNAELHEGTIRAISHGFSPTPTLKGVIEWMHR